MIEIYLTGVVLFVLLGFVLNNLYGSDEPAHGSILEIAINIEPTSTEKKNMNFFVVIGSTIWPVVLTIAFVASPFVGIYFLSHEITKFIEAVRND